MELFEHVKYTGTMVNYYFVCKRKLWLFAHNLNFESESDMVKIGKLISQTSYEREDKEIDIDQTIVIDWIDFENKIIHEVKKSNKLEEAHIWQVKYYIYYLETRKAVGFKGLFLERKSLRFLLIERIGFLGQVFYIRQKVLKVHDKNLPFYHP